MLDRLDRIEADYVALEESLGSQEVLGDQAKLREASRKYKQQTPLVTCIRAYREALGNADAAWELIAETSGLSDWRRRKSCRSDRHEPS